MLLCDDSMSMELDFFVEDVFGVYPLRLKPINVHRCVCDSKSDVKNDVLDIMSSNRR
jgi:hypothetical protein